MGVKNSTANIDAKKGSSDKHQKHVKMPTGHVETHQRKTTPDKDRQTEEVNTLYN